MSRPTKGEIEVVAKEFGWATLYWYIGSVWRIIFVMWLVTTVFFSITTWSNPLIVGLCMSFVALIGGAGAMSMISARYSREFRNESPTTRQILGGAARLLLLVYVAHADLPTTGLEALPVVRRDRLSRLRTWFRRAEPHDH